MGQLLILTGASGSGKTSIVNSLKARPAHHAVRFLHFDSIGVPSTESMVEQFGSIEEWQRIKTQEWMLRLERSDLREGDVVFEGQSRFRFFRDALETSKIARAQIVLVDCSDEERTMRLTRNRLQPELANQNMMDWAALLRREAKIECCPLIDTSHRSIEECADSVAALLAK